MMARFLSRLIRDFALLIYALPCVADGPARAHLKLLSTTDLHGNIYAVDYNTNKPDARGLARVAKVVRQTRKENPNLLLLDSGDTIQGTPLTIHHAKVNKMTPNPSSLPGSQHTACHHNPALLSFILI